MNDFLQQTYTQSCNNYCYKEKYLFFTVHTIYYNYSVLV